MASATLTACSDDTETVDNRVFDNDAYTPSTVLLTGAEEENTQTFKVQMANPMETETTVTYGADMSLVDVYNTVYGETAIALPADNYVISQPNAVFIPGAVTSTEVEVKITNMSQLNSDLVYVLPVTVVSSGVEVLPSQRTRYFVVRGAALVNTACNLVKNNCSLSNASGATGLGNLNEMTAQCVIYIDEFGGSDSNIQTIMGIEGNFLLRISDSGVPADQIQLATSRGNSTESSWKLKAKTWTRLTFTFNSNTGEATFWIDGAKKGTQISGYTSPVNWNTSSFYIGKSWNDNRWLNGSICEVRVWDRILTDAEIGNPTQAYRVPVDSEGLVAYWKFDEGAGTLIHDYANGYDLKCASAPKWIEVSLPEK